MNPYRTIKRNIIIVLSAAAVLIIAFSGAAFAVSVPSASGRIDSYDGAILRKSSTTDSSRLSVLVDNTKLTIHREVFKSASSTAKKDKWYYVTAAGKKGYVRADLVDTIKYGSVSGKTTAKVNYRKGAGTKMDLAGELLKGTEVRVVLKAAPVYSARGTSATWYKIKIGKKYYYVNSDEVELIGDAGEDGAGAAQSEDIAAASMNDEEYEKYLCSQGFPKSYRKRLRSLHRAHPEWVFTAYKTNIKWSAALAKQTRGSTSLVYGSYPKSYRNGTKQYEKGWYKASSKVVAYYMDPRNFLNENSIYMFEDLSYKPKYQTKTVVSAILKPTKFPGYGFTAAKFVSAGKASKISPVFLASRARQETGGGSDAIKGKKVLGKKVYNPFNIGAFGGKNPLYNGLIYAYGKGWTTPAKAINGGAALLAKNYINKGQYTIYYQRFNVRNGENKAGTHQYMTNIMAPYSEASSTKKSYAKYGITDKPLVFEIPVYTAMPASTKLP